LEADIKVKLHFSTVLSFKAKSIHNVTLPLFINVLGSHHFLQLVDPNRASKEETVDFGVERSSWSPCFGLNLVIAGFLGQPHESVTFNTVSTPTVY
jgi:hypothetical protein